MKKSKQTPVSPQKDDFQKLQDHDLLNRLAESERKYRELFESSRNGILYTDAERNLFDVNQAFLDMTGFSEAELKKTTYAQRTPKKWHAQDSYLFRTQVKTRGYSDAYEKEFNCKDGSTVWVRARVWAVKDEKGRLKGLWGIYRDITRQKEVREKLSQSEATLRGTFAAVPAGIALASNRVMHAVNDRFCQICGYTQEELIGKPTRMLYTSKAEYLRAGKALYPELRKKGQTSVETKWVRKDGKIVDVLINAALKDPKNPDLGEVFSFLDITEKNKSGQALRESEAKYRAIFESMQDVYYRTDAKGIITNLSPSVFACSGYQPKELIGRTAKRFYINPAERARMLKALGEFKKIHDFELHLKRKDHRIIYVSVTAKMLLDKKGRFTGVEGVLRDITERKQMEDKLRQEEKFLESVVENIPNMIFVKDAKKLSFVRFNKAGEDLLGYARKDLYGKNDYDFFPKSEADFFTGKDREVLRSGKLLDIPEEKIQTRYKGERILHTKKIPILDKNKKPLYLLGISSDITERKRMEDELRRLVAIVERTTELVSLATPDGKTIFLNEAGAKMAGITLEQANKVHVLDIIPEKWKERAQKEIMPALIKNGIWEGDQQYRNFKTGKIFDVHTIVFTIKDPVTGQIKYLANISLDISERIEAEQRVINLNMELKQKVQELEAANRDLESFSYTVAHDLRAPLRSINSFSQILTQEYSPKLESEDVDLLRRIQANARRMDTLINGLLDFAHLGRKEIKLSDVKMNKVVKMVLKELKPSLVGRSVRFNIKKLPPMHSDSFLLRQVWTNLISNAIKFTSQKSRAVITIGGRRGKKENLYYIKDNGVGFDMEFVDKIFVPFQRLHGMAQFEGAGIGLPIVKRIVERLNGRVWAKGVVDKGASFYFTLPVKQ